MPETKESINRKVTILRIFCRKNHDLAFKMLENMNIQLFIDISDIFLKEFTKFNPEKDKQQSLRDNIIKFLIRFKEALIFDKTQKEQEQNQNADKQKDILRKKEKKHNWRLTPIHLIPISCRSTLPPRLNRCLQ